MSITSAQSKRYLQLLFFLCLIVVTVGLLSTSYWAGLALLIGVGLAWFLPFAARYVRDFARNKIRLRTLLIAIPLVVVLIVGLVVSLLLGPNFGGAIPAEDQKITLESYTATIEPTSTKLQRFAIEENVRVRFGSEKEPRRFSSTHTLTPDKNRNGFSMREVRFLPMQDAEFTSSEDDTKYYITVDSDHYVSLMVTGNDASRTKLYEGSVCDNDCLLSQVQLLHFPAGAFSEADNERNFHRDDFRDTETISWSPYDLGQSVAFSYVPPPYFHVPYIHALLNPFDSVSSLGPAILVALGALIGGVGKSVDFIQMVLTLSGWWTNHLRPWLKGTTRRNSAEQRQRRRRRHKGQHH